MGWGSASHLWHKGQEHKHGCHSQTDRGVWGCGGVILLIQRAEHPLGATEVTHTHTHTPWLVSKGRAHHHSLQGPAETQPFDLCAVQAHSRTNHMARSACSPSKQQRVRRKHCFPTFTKRTKAQGNKWVQQVASFSYLIIRPLLVHGRTFARILKWQNKCFAMHYVWHLPENSWGQVSFLILAYDKVLSQVAPGDKPFVGFLHDEPKNCSRKLSGDVCISMGVH